MRKPILSHLAFLFLFSITVAAQIPKTMSYQGVLADTSGNAVADGNYNLTFRIYDVSSGGTEIWMETQTVTVVDGIFNAVLGSVAPLNLSFDQPYWLGVSVQGSIELSPRIAFTSAPYSLEPDSGSGGDGHSLDAADGDPVDAVYVDNDGKVGVGTSNPTQKLEIIGNLHLPPTNSTGSDSVGIIMSGGNRFIHDIGTKNFFAGVNAGNLSMSGNRNTAIGFEALFGNTTGGANTAIGTGALSDNISGFGNTAIGVLALNINAAGNWNTAVGAFANVSSSNLTNATAIGFDAAVNASNKIQLGNNNVTVVETAATFKSTSSGIGLALRNTTGLKINLFDDGSGIYGFGMAPAELQIGTYDNNKHISLGHYSGSSKSFVELMRLAGNGNVTGVYGNYHVASDIRKKKDIVRIPNALEKVLALRGVNFRWKDGSDNGRLQMGLIAQEVEKIVPEVVYTADDSMQTKAVEYPFLIGLLVEAVKDQQKVIEELKARMIRYEIALQELQATDSANTNIKDTEGGIVQKDY